MEKRFKKEIQFIASPKMKLWEVLIYFIIYSVAGYIIETIFALVRYGVLECRQSFLKLFCFTMSTSTRKPIPPTITKISVVIFSRILSL